MPMIRGRLAGRVQLPFQEAVAGLPCSHLHVCSHNFSVFCVSPNSEALSPRPHAAEVPGDACGDGLEGSTDIMAAMDGAGRAGARALTEAGARALVGEEPLVVTLVSATEVSSAW